jgi:hypothetical protein
MSVTVTVAVAVGSYYVRTCAQDIGFRLQGWRKMSAVLKASGIIGWAYFTYLPMANVNSAAFNTRN